jgi:hypothetical protein
MQSKDFRLGNYAMETINTTDNRVVVINKIYDSFFCWHPWTNNGFHVSIRGIILKEEWMLKLGFVRTFHGWFKNGVVLELDKNLNIRFEYHNGDIFTSKIITFVHQLQNLYFALTGEELELKHESKP